MEKSIIQINGRIMIKVDVNVKDVVYVKKDYVWNPAYSCENWKYLASIIGDSAITCNEIIQSYK